MLNGLIYLHIQKNQLHRDLKPGNVLINSRGEAKIADFGIAKDLDNKNENQNQQEFNYIYAAYLT